MRSRVESFNPYSFAPHSNVADGQSLGLIYNTFGNYNGIPGIGPGEPSDRTIDLLPGQMITVNRSVRYRARPNGECSVNLPFERTRARTNMFAAARKDRENNRGLLILLS